MSNISISAPQVNSSQFSFISEGDTCKSAVEFVCGDNTGAPVQHVVIAVQTETGKTVRLVIPNSTTDTAAVFVDDELI